MTPEKSRLLEKYRDKNVVSVVKLMMNIMFYMGWKLAIHQLKYVTDVIIKIG
jgi:hypothetical protein